MSGRTVNILVGMLILAAVIVFGTILLHSINVIQDGPGMVIAIFAGFILALVAVGILKVRS